MKGSRTHHRQFWGLATTAIAGKNGVAVKYSNKIKWLLLIFTGNGNLGFVSGNYLKSFERQRQNAYIY
jgi:hypothetical protein